MAYYMPRLYRWKYPYDDITLARIQRIEAAAPGAYDGPLFAAGLFTDRPEASVFPGCPSLGIIQVYWLAGHGYPFLPTGLNDFGAPAGVLEYTAAEPYFPPMLGDVIEFDPVEIAQAARTMASIRAGCYIALLYSRFLAYREVAVSRVHAEPQKPQQNYAMAYGNRALKNPGAWYRVNEIVRNNARLKTLLNADAVIQSKANDQLTIVRDVALANGYTLSPAESIPAKRANYFPITKRAWMGYLPFSVYNEEGEESSPFRKLYAQAATEIRDRAAALIKSFKLVADSFDEDDEANPGGQVGD